MKQHKIYDPKTKRYVEKTEAVGDLKREKLCKGKRPHNMVLVLPPYLFNNSPEPTLTIEQIERYYEIEDERAIFGKSCDERLESELGIKSRWYRSEVTRCFKCINCGHKS